MYPNLFVDKEEHNFESFLNVVKGFMRCMRGYKWREWRNHG